MQVLKELEGLKRWAREIRTLGSCRTGTDSRGKKSSARARLPKLSLYTAVVTMADCRSRCFRADQKTSALYTYSSDLRGGEHMAQQPLLQFVLYIIAFALGIASFVISVLPAASLATIGALLSIAVFCLGFAGIRAQGHNVSPYSRSRRRR